MKPRAVAVLLLALTALLWAFPGRAQTPTPSTVKVTQVDNSAYPDVTIYVSVLDASGSPVTDLPQEIFSVKEDGKPVEIINFQSVNSRSIHTWMLIDVSGSMREMQKLEGAKQAALTFIDLMRDQDEVALTAFNHAIHPLQAFTRDQDSLKRAVRDLNAGGDTAWYDAVAAAAGEIEKYQGRKSLLLLTDGLDNRSQNSFRQAVRVAQSSGATVYSIGLGPDGDLDESSLRRIAEDTGGEFTHAPGAQELEVLYRQIAMTTQSEYLLTYRSPRASFDGTRRKIEVAAGQTGGSGGYVESHLLNIQSDPMVGLACLAPLVLGLILPFAGHALVRRWQRRAPAQAAQTMPAWTPQAPPVPVPATPAHHGSYCPSCGSSLREGVRFCPSCGKPIQARPAAPAPAAPLPPAVQATRICPACGGSLRQGAKFCNACGQKLDTR